MDFNKVIDRKGSYSIKADSLLDHFGADNLIPLWVADMDFESPKCVKEALQEVVESSLYGYNTIPEEYYPTIKEWLRQEQGWSVEQNWLSFIPGVVKGIGYVINFFTKPSDAIVIQPPVYPPFINVPTKNNRRIIYNELKYANGSYEMDFSGLEQILERERPKLFILSNPHNPGGIAWSRESLQNLARLCHKYGVIVISDEIHADMPLFGAKHVPFGSVSEQAEQISITFGAPSKTFNMAGIVSSFAVVPNEKLRTDFYNWLDVNELNAPTIFATKGAIAAYTKGNEWREQMLSYIEQNILFTERFLKEIKIDGKEVIMPIRPQFSFLIWLDCRNLCKALNFNQEELVNFFIYKAGLALNNGATFGPGGEGFMRLNVGASVKLLERALCQLKDAIEKAI